MPWMIVVMKRWYSFSFSWISQEQKDDGRRSKCCSKRNVRVWVYDTGILFLWRQQNGNYYSYTAAPFSLHAMHTHARHTYKLLFAKTIRWNIAQAKPVAATATGWPTQRRKQKEEEQQQARLKRYIGSSYVPTCFTCSLCMPLRLIKSLFSLSSK